MDTQRTKRDSRKWFMTGRINPLVHIAALGRHLRRRGGVREAAIGPGCLPCTTPAWKSGGTHKSCGTKATAGLPQRRTGLQTLAYTQVFSDTAVHGD